MQLLILGMHRGGTSAVARLLNLMGAYFGPEGKAMPPDEANPKGYWERQDVWRIHERVLRSQQANWQNLARFDLEKLDAAAREQFQTDSNALIYGMDAHRPWFIKDPRLGLLLPLWRELLEVPVCVQVYRNPIQIAQSLHKRNGFPLTLGLALWEKYSLDGLRHAQGLPQVFISYHDVLQDPVSEVAKLYQALQAQGVQGLRLPAEREILAFIDPKLQRQQGDSELLEAYANNWQQALDEELSNGEALDWKDIPELSPGAQEALREHEGKLATAAEQSAQAEQTSQLEQQIEQLNQQLASLKQDQQTLIGQHQTQLTAEQQQRTQLQSRLTQTQQQLNEQQRARQQQAEQSKTWRLRAERAEGFQRQLRHDLEAAFASLTWRIGQTQANVLRLLLLRGKRPTVQNHFEQLKRAMDDKKKALNPAPSATPKLAPPPPQRGAQPAILPPAALPPRPHPLPAAVWQADTAQVDIVVCIYNALEEVKRCVASVRAHTLIPYRLILVNDGSEEPTRDWLRGLADDADILLLENETNIGYTRSANRGCQTSNTPYTVILNSDTEVTPAWLNRLLHCLESDPRAGLASPLSNAASYQSVPRVFQPGSQEWYMEPPPFDLNRWAELIAESSAATRPWLPTLNGFCIAIKRTVFERIGYFDEENYPYGYGEENDFCLRAQDAGFLTLVADDAYVYHAKSKSFSHERRKQLAAAGHKNYARKFGQERLNQNTYFVQRLNPLDAQRRRLLRLPQNGPRVAYILPLAVLVGGVISVMQAVRHLNLIGVDASVIIPGSLRDKALETFDIAPEKLIGFDWIGNLPKLAAEFDILIATANNSVQFVQQALKIASKPILPAYFVQDYEPWFYEKGSEKYQTARQSYSLIPDVLAFAKTQFLVDTVQREHPGVDIRRIRPGFDVSIYQPAAHSLADHSPLRLCAMIRPESVWRAPQATLDLFAQLAQTFPAQIEIHTFGCESQDLATLNYPAGFTHHGRLQQQALFKLLQDCDVFVDMSPYQAFGRTGLEAMAAGCVAVLPEACGTAEYAHEGNAVLVNTRDHPAVLTALRELIQQPQRRQQLKQQALETALTYNSMGDVLGQWELLSAAYRLRFKPPKVSLIMLVHNQADLTWKCLESLRKHTAYPNYELLVIDNASDAATKKMLAKAARANPRLQVLTNAENRSFSAANNQGAAQATGELLLLINNDIEALDEDWLDKLVQTLLSHPLLAAVGPCLYFPGAKKVQSAGVKIQRDADSYDFLGAEEIRSPQPSRFVDALTGACLLIWKAVYQERGGLDERYWYGQEDVDFCLNLRAAGYKLYFCAETRLIHHESATRSFNPTTLENREKIRAKWAGMLRNWS